ncbi:CRE-PAQR-2 protein [Caenorhabditis remanei]|uniref:CRE-PAQR-2 protein n=1 Tax=Caenorhabditis remanei TaxID=31234 RepID=E3LZ58_CAERE|nr:CRE-PAQR-2 protein [Caenorhabditis remanei]
MDEDDLESTTPAEAQKLLQKGNRNSFDERDMVMVLDNDQLIMENRNSSDLQSPLRSVTDVLREAENIITDGPLQQATTLENQNVIVDQVDVEFPNTQPADGQRFEIIVRHSKVVEQPANQQRDESMYATRQNRLATVLEGIEIDGNDGPSTSASTSTSTFKKGHRRAWSMPNAKGEKMTVAVIHDNHEEGGNQHRRRIVKYKLHPQRKTDESGAPQKHLRFVTAGHDAEIQLDHSDDDDELEVEINEEEVIIASETGEGTRAVIKRFWEARWKATNFETLPDWLQDNEYLRTGHRPPLPSFSSCFKSIFALHTETGNIWTHMYGCVAFFGIGLWFLTRPSDQMQWLEKLIYSAFFLGAVICLGMSFLFHTVACHSVEMSKLFSKLDYTGISLLIVGSFVPWIYFAFYCRPQPMIIYNAMIIILGIAAMVVSLWDKFAEPKFRPVRAAVFIAMGLSAVVPAFHLLVVDGVDYMMEESQVHLMILMGAMYIGGATLYATRVPERCFPGKCDIWVSYLHKEIAVISFFFSVSISSILKIRYGNESNSSFLGRLLGLDEPDGVQNWSPRDIGI